MMPFDEAMYKCDSHEMPERGCTTSLWGFIISLGGSDISRDFVGHFACKNNENIYKMICSRGICDKNISFSSTVDL